MTSNLQSQCVYSTLDELNSSTTCLRIIVHLLRTWEAQNFKRGNVLMSLDLLFLDEKVMQSEALSSSALPPPIFSGLSLLDHYDKAHLKMAMLKHEEIFREQVYELHRLYQTQKMLMENIIKDYRSNYNQPEARKCLDVEGPAEDDQSDLELTLGPKSCHQKKIKASEPALQSFGPGFSSPSTGSGNIKGTRSTAKDHEFLGWKKWGPERPAVSNQDRLNSPPWLFRALSLNVT